MELNRIYNEDCRVTLAGMLDNSVDLIVTDPPYGMEFQSGYRKVKHEVISNDDNLSWMWEVFTGCKRVLKDNGHAYFFCSFHNIDKFMQELKQVGFNIKNILIWMKNNTGMGDLEGDYAPQYEFIIFCSNGVKKLNGRRDSNILKFARTMNNLHPTEKPIDLIRYLIMKSSDIGDIVADFFSGSGTTPAGCIKENRQFIASEIDVTHYKTSIKRISLQQSQQQLF